MKNKDTSKNVHTSTNVSEKNPYWTTIKIALLINCNTSSCQTCMHARTHARTYARSNPLIHTIMSVFKEYVQNDKISICFRLFIICNRKCLVFESLFKHKLHCTLFYNAWVTLCIEIIWKSVLEYEYVYDAG